jgi:ABC-type uncharacterized transport system substrate-binding protein
VLVTAGVPAAKAAKNATSTIPIVLASSGDAGADSLVASFALALMGRTRTSS